MCVYLHSLAYEPLHLLIPPSACVCVCAIADRLVNGVCLQADGSQGADLFRRMEAEAAQCLMSPPGKDHRRDGEGGGGGCCRFIAAF